MSAQDLICLWLGRIIVVFFLTALAWLAAVILVERFMVLLGWPLRLLLSRLQGDRAPRVTTRKPNIDIQYGEDRP